MFDHAAGWVAVLSAAALSVGYLRTRDRFGLWMAALLLALALGAGGAVRVQLGPLEVDLRQSQLPVTPVRIPRRGPDISTSRHVPSLEVGHPDVPHHQICTIPASCCFPSPAE